MTSSLLLELTSVCITTVSSAKTDEPIKTSFAWGVDPWPKEPRIRSGCGYPRANSRGTYPASLYRLLLGSLQDYSCRFHVCFLCILCCFGVINNDNNNIRKGPSHSHNWNFARACTWDFNGIAPMNFLIFLKTSKWLDLLLQGLTALSVVENRKKTEVDCKGA